MDLLKKYESISFKNGKFLADKSYAFDTVFFVSRFILDYSKNSSFDLNDLKKSFIEYIATLINRGAEKSDIQNYYSEVLNLLIYAGVIKIDQDKKGVYTITDQKVLNFISKRLENSYIFLYILCYYTLKNSELLTLYEEYCKSTDEIEEQKILGKLNEELSNVNPSVMCSSDSQWAKQNTKYIVNVMNYYNVKPPITRTLKIDKGEGVQNVHSISVNTKGTRTTVEKSNEYLNEFDFEYVDSYLNSIKVR
jgi:hypothetical protein